MGCCASKPKGPTPPMEEAALIKDTEAQKEASDPLNIRQKEKAEEIQSEPLYLVPFQEWTPPDWSPPLEEADVPLGEVYLTVHHIPANNQVAVRLMRARHLHRRGDTADIQFAMYLCYPSGKRDEQKSTIKKSTIDPVLDERFFWEIDHGEKGEDTVLRLVANDLTQDSPYLGEIVIGIGRMGFGLLNPAWIPLRKEKFIPKIETPPETRTSTPSPSSGLEIPLLSSVASAATGAMSGAIHGATSVTKGAVNVTMGAVNLARNSLHIPDFSPRKSDDGFSVAQSFMSSASNASNSAIVKMHEYGRVYLSLYYKIPQNIVEIAVVSARLDRPANLPLPNPYVKIKVVPDLSGKVGKQKTKAQKSTNEPFFNESFSVQVEKKDSQKLQVSLWSNELGKNPFLGEALINLSTLPANETVKDWFPLESLSHGELNCHLSYDHQSDALTVTVIKARDLGNGNSQIDPYVKVYLLPDAKKSSKRKTKFKKQTLNPEFNESFRYFLPEFENAHMKFLHLSVLNHNSIGHQDPVGSFSIPLADIIEAQSIERWFPLIRDKAGAEKPTSPNTPVRKEE